MLDWYKQWDPSCQHWRKAACGAGLQTTSKWCQPHERTPPRSNHGKTLLHASRVVIHNHNTLHSPPQPVASMEKAGLTNKVPGRQMDEHAVSVWNQITLPKCALHLSTSSEKVTIKTSSIYYKLEDSDDASSSDEEYLYMTENTCQRSQQWMSEWTTLRSRWS